MGTGLGVVKSQSASESTVANGRTCLGVVGLSGVINGAKSDITETLQVTALTERNVSTLQSDEFKQTQENLRVGRQSNADNGANLVEELSDGVLVNVERQVADEESVALRADGIAVLLSAVGSTGLRSGIVGASVGIVKVDGTATNILTLHGLVSLGSGLGILKVDITETTAAASSLLSNDTSTNKAIERLESLVQGIVIDAPGQAASEEGGSSVAVDLGLLGRGIILVVSLALLGSGGILLLLIRRVIAVLLRVARVRLGLLKKEKKN